MFGLAPKSDRAQIEHDRPIGYANKRAEVWGNMRESLRDGAIDSDPELIADLTGIEYGYVLPDGRDAIQLERKEDMKRRGLPHPTMAMHWPCTFAYPVLASSAARSRRPGRFFRSSYDPFSYEQEEGRYSSPEWTDAWRADIKAEAEWLRRRAMGLPE